MFATSARVSPCRARIWRSSPTRVITRWPSLTAAVSPVGTGWASLPLGPSARTRAPSTCTLTPAGMVTGCLPIRDMGALLPHVGEHFAADLLLARVAVAHHPAGGGQEGHPHSAQDGWDTVVGDVHPTARRRHPNQARDHLLVARPVLEVHPQGALLVVLQNPEVLDEALVPQQLGQADLEL